VESRNGKLRSGLESLRSCTSNEADISREVRMARELLRQNPSQSWRSCLREVT
jgi:hypothetical protein